MTEALWHAVAETERLFDANMAHAVMLASMYGHPDANLDKGNEQIHEMYLSALGTMPYFRGLARRRADDSAALVEEWRRMNAKDRAVGSDAAGVADSTDAAGVADGEGR